MRRWVRHGTHRVPAPGSLHALADEARTRAAAPTATIRVVPPGDTLVFDVPGSWTGPLPVRTPGPSRPPVVAPMPPGDLRRVRDRIAELGQSLVRDGVQVTARASSFRFQVRCFTCGRVHGNTNADRFADLYASAAQSGWRQDLYGSSWRCPRCARRHNAAFGVRPVAAIAPATIGGEKLWTLNEHLSVLS